MSLNRARSSALKCSHTYSSFWPHRVFTQWLQYTQYQLQLQHGIDYVQERLNRRCIAKYFTVWAEAAWEGPRVRLAMEFAAAKMKHRKLPRLGIQNNFLSSLS
jgi:hypothetical protein